MQRMNWKVMVLSPLPKLSVAFLFFFTFYLLACDTHPRPVSKYHDLTVANYSALMNDARTSYLVRTLEENEKRYQFTIVEREKLIEISGGRHIAAFPPPHTVYYVLWDFFTPAFTCPFPMYRVGLLADGGKWSAVWNAFELDMLERSPGCHIYGFDANATHDAPSEWPWGEPEVTVDAKLRSRLHFNHFSVADRTAERYRSLQSVMSDFGHDWIDILKIDLEGSEFATFVSIITDNQENPLPFSQLLLEVHIGWSEGTLVFVAIKNHPDRIHRDMRTVDHFANWFTRLEQAGLRPYYFEVSMMDVNTLRVEPAVAYWSFMNFRGRHALVDDGLPEYP
ncbi:hypothetical protein B0H19DRAFT_1259524 [Mycena capillaripes]|nr:hypothetical protein B0H19DRAFT_1259524 [Mycena capillaripes]